MLKAAAIVISLSFAVAVGLSWWRSPGLIQLMRNTFHYDHHTRGMMHYLSMEGGMGSCWNDTMKSILQLSCPGILLGDEDMLIEASYLLTSCFCLSTGHPAINCPPRPGDDYHLNLIKCAKKKCFNKHGLDAFEINHSHMSELCYYFTYEKTVHPERINECYTEDLELERLQKMLKGEDTSQFNNQLGNLHGLVSEVLRKRRAGIVSWLAAWFKEQYARFSVGLDNVNYKFRLGRYAHVPSEEN